MDLFNADRVASIKREHETVLGRLIVVTTTLENIIENILVHYFVPDPLKGDLLRTCILDRPSFGFEDRVRALGSLFKIAFSGYLDGYPQLLSGLRAIQRARNELAHGRLDLSPEAPAEGFRLSVLREGARQWVYYNQARVEELFDLHAVIGPLTTFEAWLDGTLPPDLEPPWA